MLNSSGHRVFSTRSSPQDIEFSLAFLDITDNAMAFASLFALAALAAVVSAAPATETAVCPDGTRVTNEACCAFIPVGFLQ